MSNMKSTSSYKQATPFQRNQLCNGCGSHGFTGKLVPDVILNRCISEACNIHDWMYSNGDNKLVSDIYFLYNLIYLEVADFNMCSFLRIPIYFMYYIGVSLFGAYYYFKATNFKYFNFKRIKTLWTSIFKH